MPKACADGTIRMAKEFRSVRSGRIFSVQISATKGFEQFKITILDKKGL